MLETMTLVVVMGLWAAITFASMALIAGFSWLEFRFRRWREIRSEIRGAEKVYTLMRERDLSIDEALAELHHFRPPAQRGRTP